MKNQENNHLWREFKKKKSTDLGGRAPENAGTWAHVPRHIRDIADNSIFCSVFRISGAKSAQALVPQ